MKKVYVNEAWCLGCHLCEYNCAFAHADTTDMVKALKGKEVKSAIQVETSDSICFAVSCRHCETPLCKEACIAGAISIVDGRVEIDQTKCVKCYTCVLVCPYGAVVPTETGVLEKCQLCSETAAGEPACVKGCPNQAIVYEER